MPPVKPAPHSPVTSIVATTISYGLLGWSLFLVGFLLFAIFVAPLLH